MPQIGIQSYPYTDVKDSKVDAVGSIDDAHKKIHDSGMFTYSEVVDLTSGASRNIKLVTPATKDIHLYMRINSEGETNCNLFEDVVTSGTLTPFTLFNRDRGSAVVPTLTMGVSPTITSSGTLIETDHFFESNIAIRDEDEWIPDISSNYLVNIRNDSASNNQVTLKLNWYEVTIV